MRITVKELIEKLGEFDGDLRVRVWNCEDESVKDLQEIAVDESEVVIV